MDRFSRAHPGQFSRAPKLTRLSPPARDLLRSRDIWDRVADEAAPGDTFNPPTYHVGRTDKQGDLLDRTAHLPWTARDSAEKRFKKLHDAVLGEVGERNAKPRLDTTLDRYLRTLWYLSLAAPLDYLDGTHPFDLTGKTFPEVHYLSNAQKGAAEARPVSPTKTIRETLGLKAPLRATGPLARFEIFVDNVKLLRPLAFDGAPASDRTVATRTPLLFIGKFAPNLSPIPHDQRGGAALEFETYLLWMPRVVPTDHNGVMVRIADASGTLFDNTFMGYQVAEVTRLSQISGEVFTLAGLDGALNIDRESFNFGHPHAKILASWLHRALRQIATTQKRIAKDSREKRRARETARAQEHTEQVVAEVVESLGLEEAPEVQFHDDPDEVRRLRRSGVTAFDRTVVWGAPAATGRRATQAASRTAHERKMEAALQVLDAYGLLDRLTYAQQHTLIRALSRIIGEPT